MDNSKQVALAVQSLLNILKDALLKDDTVLYQATVDVIDKLIVLYDLTKERV